MFPSITVSIMYPAVIPVRVNVRARPASAENEWNQID